MDVYFTVKTLHILSSTILFGTGIGIAFFMFCSRFAKTIQERYYAARATVLADYIFTLPAVILQPLTGIWLIINGGYDAHTLWLSWTYGLYILVGLCWLPVVWIQIRLKRMLAHCHAENLEIPANYDRLFRIWFILGWPAFLSLLAIFFLMVAKPV